MCVSDSGRVREKDREIDRVRQREREREITCVFFRVYVLGFAYCNADQLTADTVLVVGLMQRLPFCRAAHPGVAAIHGQTT